MAVKAQISSVRTQGAQGFAWQWHAADGRKSASTFPYYYDCVEDARKSGYDVVLEGDSPKRVDGSEGHGLA